VLASRSKNCAASTSGSGGQSILVVLGPVSNSGREVGLAGSLVVGRDDKVGGVTTLLDELANSGVAVAPVHIALNVMLVENGSLDLFVLGYYLKTVSEIHNQTLVIFISVRVIFLLERDSNKLGRH